MRCRKIPVCLRGSLTIEAALSLTLFLFMVILLSVPMELLNTQRKVQMVLETAAREISRQAWLAGEIKNGELWNGEPPDESDTGKIEEKESTEETENALWTVDLSEAAAALFLERAIRNATGSGRLESLDCSGTRISSDREVIDLRAKYSLKLPFSVFALDSVRMSSRSKRRGWIGREGGRLSGVPAEEEGQVMVYVGKASVRYHTSPECHYLSNRTIPVSFEAVEEYRNASGSGYKSCGICGSEAGAGQIVYLFPNGENYHSRLDCSSLSFYLRKVPLEEVSHLGCCSYCGGG